jgi:hypothetical protein
MKRKYFARPYDYLKVTKHRSLTTCRWAHLCSSAPARRFVLGGGIYFFGVIDDEMEVLSN